MKRMIRSSESADDLFDRLSDDLSNTFEDNIVMRYAKYSDPDGVDHELQGDAYHKYQKARLAYLRAVEQVIRDVDVNDFV